MNFNISSQINNQITNNFQNISQIDQAKLHAHIYLAANNLCSLFNSMYLLILMTYLIICV